MARDLVARIRDAGDGIESLWHLDGRATAGKSTALERIAEQLRADTGLLPILVAPPARHLDAGPAALVDIANGLANHGLVKGAYDEWLSERTWRAKMQGVRDWLADYRDQIVLLCDEPRQWGANRSADDLFAARSADVARLVVDHAPCRRVVAGRLFDSSTPIWSVRLHVGAPDHSWLQASEAWGELSETVDALVNADVDLTGCSALEIRLLVAGAAVASVDIVASWLSERTRRIPQRLAELLSRQAEGHTLWQAWHALSATRRPFPREFLGRLEPLRIGALDHDVIQHCLLYGDERLRLHDVLRVQASRWRIDVRDRKIKHIVERTNRTLFDFYRDRFAAHRDSEPPLAVRDALEAFHHASSLGDLRLSQEIQQYFGEQLDALGWSLSFEHRRYADAAVAFRSAIAWNENDDYAHHYLAFNLQRSAGSASEIERHYRKAVELNDQHPWWHSRSIMFLLARGRIEEAKRAWEEASSALGVGEGDAGIDLYETLHCWVSGALLASGELTFARRVLDDVPEWARQDIAAYRRLDERWQALMEAHETGAFVPGHRLRQRWWTRGPELLGDRIGEDVGDERRLLRWLAGRVESVDLHVIRLRVAEITPGQQEPPRAAWLEIDPDRFCRLCRDDVRPRDLYPGRFVEIGLYAPQPPAEGTTLTLIRVIDEQPWPDEAEQTFFGRYESLTAAA